MDVERYLERIDVRWPLPSTAETLRELQRAHLLHVPFESYDCALGRPVTVDPASNFAKIVERRRGGFCFELNGLFGFLLDALGFEVTYLSARPFVVGRESDAEPEFSHLALLVPADGERWLVDVGFGDGAMEPLRLDETADQERERGRRYRVMAGAADRPWAKIQLFGGEDAEAYFFTLEPRRLEDFAGMCRYYSTAPDSWFVRSPVCSRATLDGRVTLAERRRLIVTSDGVRTESLLESESGEREALREWFGVDLGPDR
jgi:N-hydroxyarylamine O-acetyltransferase